MSIKKVKPSIFSPPQGPKVLKNSTAWCWLDNSGVIFCNGFGNQTLEVAKENIVLYTQCCEGKARPMLLDFTGMQYITREARAYYSSTELEDNRLICPALAILTTSLIEKLIANFFIGLNKSAILVKLFTDAEEAKDWLMKFVENNNSTSLLQNK